jgi:tetratricopeptide (TPR) repeat protein
MNNQNTDNLLDYESIKMLELLPTRPKIVQYFILSLKGFGTFLYLIGGIGVAAIAYNHLTSSKPYSYFLYLIPLAPLIIGSIFQGISKYFLYENAPIGNLVMSMIHFLFKGQPDKVSEIANKIISIEIGNSNSKGYYFAQAISYELLAEVNEISSNRAKAKNYSNRAIEYFTKLTELEIKTPFFYYTFANAYRIAEINQEAIIAYDKYLKLRPNDEGTKKVLEEIKFATENKNETGNKKLKSNDANLEHAQRTDELETTKEYCPNGCGELKPWDGKPRCWKCGWPEK